MFKQWGVNFIAGLIAAFLLKIIKFPFHLKVVPIDSGRSEGVLLLEREYVAARQCQYVN